MFPGNKRKALTFSFDDGVSQDKRLVAIFNKYGFKATWNLNSALLSTSFPVTYHGVTSMRYKVTPEEVNKIYKGHEVAIHTLTHPNLVNELDDNVVIKEIEEDRLALEKLVGYPIVGMAYPYGTSDDRIINIIRNNSPILYSRTTKSTYNFDRQSNLLQFNPTIHILDKDLEKVVDEFIKLKTNEDKILYIWGHAYEFDIDNTWDEFERIIAKLAGKNDIFYGTNKEVLIDNK